jgi:SAM-dependent methyltransferase
MATFRLKDRFDVVVSLFSCIGYVRTDAGLRGAIWRIAEHLKPGGVALIEPWFGPDFEAGRMFMHTYDGADVKVVRMSRSYKKGRLSTLEMNFMVMERGKPLLRFTEKHHLGLFEMKRMLELFRKIGLKTKLVRAGSFKDRGLIVAVEPLIA